MLVYRRTIFKWQIFPFSAFSVGHTFLFCFGTLILIVITLAKCVICNALIHATNWNVTGGTSHTEWICFFSCCYYGVVMPFRLSWIEFLFDHKERTERLSSIKKITTNWQHNWISVHFNINWSRCRSLIVLVKVFLYSFCFVFIQNELDKCVNVIFVQSFINFADRCHQSLFSVRGPVSVLNCSLSLVFNTNIKYLLHFSSTLNNIHFQLILCITQK